VKRVEILAFFEGCSLRLPTASVKSPPGDRSLCGASLAVNKKGPTLGAAKTSASYIAFSMPCLSGVLLLAKIALIASANTAPAKDMGRTFGGSAGSGGKLAARRPLLPGASFHSQH